MQRGGQPAQYQQQRPGGNYGGFPQQGGASAMQQQAAVLQRNAQLQQVHTKCALTQNPFLFLDTFYSNL
jgi:hypothetical protein